MGMFDQIVNRIRGGELSEDEVRQIMQHLATKPRWILSDTPGMGNVPPWSVMATRGLSPSAYEQYQKKEAENTADLSNLPFDARMEAEQRFLDADLADLLRRRGGGMLPVSQSQSRRGMIDGTMHPNPRPRRGRHGGGGVRG